MNYIAITLDIDWAPDFMIDFVAEKLAAKRVKATWFVTHQSPAIDRLRQHPGLFELGIHPNFLPGSTHGTTTSDILHHCMGLVPEAISMRTHALVQSSPLLAQVMKKTPITIDVSLLLPYMPELQPVEYYWQGNRLLRIPYFWEDDLEMERPSPCWHLAPLLEASKGLKVFDFHPIHIYLNSANMEPYQALKKQAPDLMAATPTQAKSHIEPNAGTQTMFLETIEYLANTKQSLCVRDIEVNWQSHEESGDAII